MQKLFVEYELAKRLKGAGFTGPCPAFYDEKGGLHPNTNTVATCREFFRMSGLDSYDNDDEVFIDFDPNKEKGLEDYSAPIYQQVFDWLEGKGYEIKWKWVAVTNKVSVSLSYDDDEVCAIILFIGEYNRFAVRKKAWDEAIEEALKLLKGKDGNY